jgi:hypothetical protein
METELHFDEKQTLELRRALVNMPYGGLVNRRVDTAEGVLTWILSFRSVMERVAADNTRESLELDELKRNVAGMRKLFLVD